MLTRIWQRTGVGIAGLVLALTLPVHSAVSREAEASGPTAILLSPGLAAPSPVGQLLGRQFTLPRAERSVKVTRALTTDFDADGDIDAVASTSAGTIVVWLNVGQNRLERLPPRRLPAARTHLGRPVAQGAHTLHPDTTDGRWLYLPARRQIDVRLLLQSALPRSTQDSVGAPRFTLPSRAPPHPTRYAR